MQFKILNHGIFLPQPWPKWDNFVLFTGIVIDRLWKLRNDHIFSGKVIDHEVLRKEIHGLWSEHIRSREDTFHHMEHDTGMSSLKRWLPPLQGYIKVNFDAAYKKDKMVLAAKARDSFGNVLWAITKMGVSSCAFTKNNVSIPQCAYLISWL